MSVTVNDKMPRFVTGNEQAMDRALSRMAVDVERISKEKVPVKHGLLRASGYHIRNGYLSYWMGFRKIYAGFQEFGGDGRRTVRKYTYAGRGKGFLRDAGTIVASKALEYFRNEGGQIRV